MHLRLFQKLWKNKIKQTENSHIKIKYKSVSWSCKQTTWFKVMSSLHKYTLNIHLELHEQVLRVGFLTLAIYSEYTWNLPWAVIFTSTLSCVCGGEAWRMTCEPTLVFCNEQIFFIFAHHSGLVSVRAQFSAIYNSMHVWRVLWVLWKKQNYCQIFGSYTS